MDEADERRLRQRWKEDTVISSLPELAPSVGRGDGRFSMLTNFCPEVTYELLGFFASGIYGYADEIDRDLAHASLGKKGVSVDDPRWRWASIAPLHYRDCPTYSLLQPRELLRRNEEEEAQPGDATGISDVTRQPIMDYLSLGRSWAGRLQEDTFLARLYDLNKLPSTDYRSEFNTAALDIHQHRVRNYDWPDDWLFNDSRFNLAHAPDKEFLRFLVETVHPIVRPDSREAEAMVTEYNALLAADGWEIFEQTHISGKTIYGYRRTTGTSAHIQVRQLVEGLSGAYIAEQANRLYRALEDDPSLAIGTAKELLETVCKTILTSRNVPYSRNEDLPPLLKMTIKQLSLIPNDIAAAPHADKSTSVLLASLGSVGQHVAELRNQFGTGHGKVSGHIGLEKRHARLVVGAVVTVANFLYESHLTTPTNTTSH